jgi:hypothetical protein
MRTRVIRAAAALAAILAVEAATPPAAGDAPSDVITAEKRGLVARLESLATWCDGQKIAGERDRVFRVILTLDPEHVRARSVLKFTRAKKGAPWVQAADYKEPPDWNKGNLPEAARRRAEAALAFRDGALAALSAGGAEVPSGKHEELVETAIDVAPGDGKLRRERGDVQEGDRWVLVETADARKRRAEIGKAVARARSLSLTERPAEQRTERKWPAAFSTDDFWVAGTVPQAECRLVIRSLETGRRFLADQLGAVEGEEPYPRRVYLFDDAEVAKSWVGANPDFREFRRLMDQVGGGALSRQEFVAYYHDADVRIAAALSAAVSDAMTNRFAA